MTPSIRLRLDFEPADTRAQLPVVVAQLPVRFCEPVEPPGHLPGPHEGSQGDDDGRTAEEPL